MGCVTRDRKEKEFYWPAASLEARERKALVKVECLVQHFPTWNIRAILKDVKHRYTHTHAHPYASEFELPGVELTKYIS